jgi:cytochrome c peroxidase
MHTKRIYVASLAIISATGLTYLLSNGAQLAVAQNSNSASGAMPSFAPASIEQSQAMRRFKDPSSSAQPTPPVIQQFSINNDPSGKIATFQPSGATITANNAFFQNLGTNGRTCLSCHQPQEGWGVSAAGVQARFAQSGGTEPIFRLVDGATCPTAQVGTLAQRQQAYKLLTNHGLIRIGLQIPANAEFAVTKVVDPYNCTTNPEIGLTSPTTGIVSVYRRPLPSTNLGFLSARMWDGREPSLESQAADATLIHAQGQNPPTATQVGQIVQFESGIFTAQVFDNKAGSLTANGATGGPTALSLELPNFFIGINDPVGLNPRGIPFTSQIFNLYQPWAGPGGTAATVGNTATGANTATASNATTGSNTATSSSSVIAAAAAVPTASGVTPTAAQQSIARGQAVFNNTVINITGVSGLNDDLNQPSISGFCGTCHDTPQVGNHSVAAPLNIGIAGAAPPALNVTDLPLFTLTCKSGALAGQVFTTTDPGRALISGLCKDIGRFKGPILRGLAARAPYFHNGAAATLLDVVNFYDQRFSLGFTDQQKTDLVNFLNAL